MQNPSIVFVVLCMMGCSHGHAAKEAVAKEPTVAKQIDPNYGSEVLDVDSILLNRSIPFRSSVDGITAVLGNPDSIVSTSHECGGFFEVDQVRNYYYGRTRFEVYGDTGVIRNIDIGDARFRLTAGSAHLDSRTSLATIGELFPRSASQAYPIKDEAGKEVLLVRLKAEPSSDDVWVLHFQDGHLVEVEYWIPC